jgi:RHS repeat-associated protein
MRSARSRLMVCILLLVAAGRSNAQNICGELNWLCFKSSSDGFSPPSVPWELNAPAVTNAPFPGPDPSPDRIPPCDPKVGSCEIDGAPRWPGAQWNHVTPGKLNVPNAKPGEFWPPANYGGTSDRVNEDLNAVRANCSGVDPHCLSPVLDVGAQPVAFQGDDPRVPTPQRAEIASSRLSTPGTDPVAANGSFHITETDLRFPGFIPYTFTRYYRSDVTFQSPLGYGWNHNYGRRIVLASGRSDSPNGCSQSVPDVFYVSPTMDQIRFSFTFSDAEGLHYTSALEPSLRLYKAAGQNGAWVLQEVNELLYYIFEPEHGDLVSIRDHTGHSITLAWKHPPPINGDVYEDPSGYLDTVVDTRGQSIYYRYAEPGKEPITPPFPGWYGKKFRPLRCITLSAAADACDSAPLLTFQMDAGSPRAKDYSHPEFNLVHVADGKGQGPTYTYYSSNILDYGSLDRPYVPDGVLEATCSGFCGSKQDDCRNFDLCSVESIRACDMATPTAILSRAEREASPAFKFCMANQWDGTNEHLSLAYHDCNVNAGCPLGEKLCKAYGAVYFSQCWRWPGFDKNGFPYPLTSCGGGFADFVWSQRDNVDRTAQWKQQCISQAQAAAAPGLPKCRADCKTQCLGRKSAHDDNAVRRYAYGVPLSLNHNLLKVMDADQRLVIDNTYGTDPFSADFDRVIQHAQGSGSDNVMKFEYHDFASERSAFAKKPNPDLLAGFKSVQICPAAQSGLGYDPPQSLAIPNSIQQPAYGVKVTDIAGVTRINFFDSRWNPLREMNVTAGVSVDYNYRDGFVTAVQDSSGARSCYERDDAGRITQNTRLPFPARFAGIPWDSASPEVTTYSYDDAGMLVQVIRDPDGPAPTGILVIRDGYERVAAIGQAVSRNKTLWTCYAYSPPPEFSVTISRVGLQPPNASPNASMAAAQRASGESHAVPSVSLSIPRDLQQAVQPQVTQNQVFPSNGLLFARSGCARNLIPSAYNPAAKVAVAPYTIWKPDGTSIMQSSMTAFGPSETAVDAQGDDAVLTYIEHDLQDPFGLNQESGRGSLKSRKFGSATRIIADKTTGILQTISTQDPNDGAWVDRTLNYGLSRQLTSVKEDSLERKFDTDELGHLRSIQEFPDSDPFGTQPRSTCFRYDMVGRLLDRMLPEGNVEHYTYNPLGFLASISLEAVSEVPAWASPCSVPVAIPARVARRAQNRALSIVSKGVNVCSLPQNGIDKPEEILHLTYDKGGLATAMDLHGLHTALVRDGFGRVIDTVTKHHIVPTLNGSLLTVSRHHVVRYDSLGRMAWEGVFDAAPDRYNKPSKLSPSLYAMTEYQYDGVDRIVARDDWRFVNNGIDPPQEDPAGLVARTTFTYDDEHGQVSVTDPGGKVTEVKRDGGGRVKHITKAKGTNDETNADHFYADGGDVVTVQTTEAPKVRTYAFNPRGHITTITVNGDQNSPLFEASYDKLDRNETRRVQGMGLSSFRYDAFSRLREEDQVTEDGNNAAKLTTTTYLLDGNDRLSKLTDGAGKTTEFCYDGLDRPWELINGLGTSIFTYFPGSNRVKRSLDPAQTSQDFNYGDDGQLIEQYTTDGAGLSGNGAVNDRTFFYTIPGQLARAVLVAGGPRGADLTVSFQYDSLGRVVSEANDTAPVSILHTYATESSSTALLQGNVPAATLKVSLDNLYRPLELDLMTNNRQLNLAKLTYKDDALFTLEYGNKTLATLGRDTRGRLTSVDLTLNNAPLASIQDNLGFDSVPRERRRKLGPAASVMDYYQTDRAGRLVSENLLQIDLGFHGPDISNAAVDAAMNKNLRFGMYSLDGASNLLARAGTSPLTLGAPDAANRYPSVNGAAVTYDKAGNVSGYGNESYTFNGLGHLVNAEAGANSVSYSYDALGRVIREQRGNAATLFVWDGPNLVAMGPDNGRTDDLRLVAGIGATRRQALIDGLGKGPIWYLHAGSDLLSTLAVTDETGKFVEGYAYSASGTPTFFDGNGNKAPGSAQNIGNRFLYQAQLYDPGLSLYAMGLRFYKPAWQRFLSPDPLGTIDDPNLYGFVRGQVLTHWDPSGLTGRAQHNFYSTARLIGPDKVADWTDDLASGIERAPYDPAQMARNRPPIDPRLSPTQKSLLNSFQDVYWNAASISQASDFYVIRDNDGKELGRTWTGLAGTAPSWFQPGDLAGASVTKALGLGASGVKALAAEGATGLVEGAAPVVGEVLEAGATNVAEGGAGSLGPGIKAYGTLWERVTANGLRDLLKDTGLEVLEHGSARTFKTPDGLRFLDILVRDPATGRIIGAIENKAGGSAYTALQAAKDAWIMKTYGFPIFEYRFPFARAFFEINW